MRISLCMIVRDEEERLPDCLASVRGIVDEIVVVDTGSTDRTREIAAAAGATVLTAMWENDFANARNVSLAGATGDWVLVLDADERLSPGGARLLRPVLEASAAEGLRVLVRDHVGHDGPMDVMTNVSTRLFRNRACYRYERRIHEQIETAIVRARLGPIVVSEIVVDHFGYLSGVVETKHKRERNLCLLEAEAEEIGDPFAHYNLGIEYIRHRRYSEGLEQLSVAENGLDPAMLISAEIVHRKASCLMALDRREEALDLLSVGIARYPDFTDLAYLLGETLFALNRYSEAIAAFERCRESGDPVGTYYSLQGIGGYRSAYAIGLVYHHLKQHASALEWYRTSLQENPAHYESLLRIAEVLSESLGDVAAVDSELAKYFNLESAGARQAYLQALFTIGRYATALPIAAQLLQERPDEPRILLCGATCALRCREYNRAAEWAQALVALGAFVQEALLVLVVSHWCLGMLNESQSDVTLIGRGNQVMLFAVCQQAQWQMEGRQDFGITASLDDTEKLEAYVGASLTVLGMVASCGATNVLEKALAVMRPVADLRAWVRLGLLYYKYGEYDLAAAELEDCDRQGAFSAESLFVLGRLALAGGEAKRAAEYLHRAVELEPQLIEPRLLLSASYRRLAEEVLLDGIMRHPDAIVLIRQLETLRKGGAAHGTSADR